MAHACWSMASAVAAPSREDCAALSAAAAAAAALRAPAPPPVLG